MTNLRDEQKSCTCAVCQGACKHKPGWFMPGEAEKAAKLMNMPLKKFFDTYLGVDWWNGKEYGDEIFVLSPLVRGGTPGDIFPQNPQGQCIFYEEGRCRIHAARPRECREYWHGAPGEDGPKLHKEVAMSWKGEPQKQIEELLGTKPVAPEANLLDIFGFMTGFPHINF